MARYYELIGKGDRRQFTFSLFFQGRQALYKVIKLHTNEYFSCMRLWNDLICYKLKKKKAVTALNTKKDHSQGGCN